MPALNGENRSSASHAEGYEELDEIRTYIADENPDSADRVVTEIFDRFRALVTLPHQGYRRPHLASRPLRFKLVREYAIAAIRRGGE
ncbi:MAG: type II toxin-antitoxin system RelE/ParE family toxin [Acidobacteriia bacterium]|nr:type II toxin-antitoxin system RelE/ParE family toxin [Terriglobia bacterium]